MTVTIVRDKSFSVFEGKITAEIADLDEEQDINIVIDDTSFGVCECEGEE
jgi:hypothetical protein